MARAQFAQYGMTNLPDDVLQNYAKSLLEKEESVRDLYDRATENKLIDWLKEHVTVIEKEVFTEEFNQVMEEHAHIHGEGSHEEHEHDETDEVEEDTTDVADNDEAANEEEGEQVSE